MLSNNTFEIDDENGIDNKNNGEMSLLNIVRLINKTVLNVIIKYLFHNKSQFIFKEQRFPLHCILLLIVSVMVAYINIKLVEVSA